MAMFKNVNVAPIDTSGFERAGAAYGQMFQNLGNTVADSIQKHRAKKEEKEKKSMLAGMIGKMNPTILHSAFPFLEGATPDETKIFVDNLAEAPEEMLKMVTMVSGMEDSMKSSATQRKHMRSQTELTDKEVGAFDNREGMRLSTGAMNIAEKGFGIASGAAKLQPSIDLMNAQTGSLDAGALATTNQDSRAGDLHQGTLDAREWENKTAEQKYNLAEEQGKVGHGVALMEEKGRLGIPLTEREHEHFKDVLPLINQKVRERESERETADLTRLNMQSQISSREAGAKLAVAQAEHLGKDVVAGTVSKNPDGNGYILKQGDGKVSLIFDPAATGTSLSSQEKVARRYVELEQIRNDRNASAADKKAAKTEQHVLLSNRRVPVVDKYNEVTGYRSMTPDDIIGSGYQPAGQNQPAGQMKLNFKMPVQQLGE